MLQKHIAKGNYIKNKDGTYTVSHIGAKILENGFWKEAKVETTVKRLVPIHKNGDKDKNGWTIRNIEEDGTCRLYSPDPNFEGFPRGNGCNWIYGNLYQID
jgi:hypothetical protein